MSNDEPEIEVTKKMIDAGGNTVNPWDDWPQDFQIAKIYRAMEACRPEALKQANEKQFKANTAELISGLENQLAEVKKECLEIEKSFVLLRQALASLLEDY